MNIFFLHWSPRIAAEYHCDKHVVKMIIECAQMLYCSHWEIDPTKLMENAYKKAHPKHPSTLWVQKSIYNYAWLCSLAWWLCKEYTFRYGKIHKTQQHIEWLFSNIPALPTIHFTKPPLAMPNEYKQKNVIKAYRMFYIESKMKQRNIVKYTSRSPPDFLKYTADNKMPQPQSPEVML